MVGLLFLITIQCALIIIAAGLILMLPFAIRQTLQARRNLNEASDVLPPEVIIDSPASERTRKERELSEELLTLGFEPLGLVLQRSAKQPRLYVETFWYFANPERTIFAAVTKKEDLGIVKLSTWFESGVIFTSAYDQNIAPDVSAHRAKISAAVNMGSVRQFADLNSLAQQHYVYQTQSNSGMARGLWTFPAIVGGLLLLTISLIAWASLRGVTLIWGVIALIFVVLPVCAAYIGSRSSKIERAVLEKHIDEG